MITNKKYHQKPDIVDNISGYVIFGFYACLIIFFAIALTGPQWLYQAGKNERRLEASEIIAYAIELAKSGEHEKAISTLEVAISKAGDLPDIYINYGLSLESLGRYYQAITAYNKAIEFGSRDSSNIYYMISGIYSRYKDKDSIEKYFWKSINVNPYNIDKYLKLGGYYLYKMQWDSSMAALTKAFELQQDMREHYRNMLLSLYYNSDISDTLSYKYIKILSQQNIGYIDSRYDYRIFNIQSSKDKRHAIIHNQLGFVNVNLGNYQAGLDNFIEAINIWPDYPDALSNLQFTNKKMKRK